MITNKNIDNGRSIDASLPKNKTAEFEKEHLSYLKTQPESFTLPHYVSILDLKKSI